MLAAIDAEARAEGIACLYGSLDPTDGATAHLVQTFGHRLVEVALTFERPDLPFTPRASPTRVRRGTPDDLPALEPAIKTLAPWSRFAVDPRFGPDAARRMHEAWMERAARDDTTSARSTSPTTRTGSRGWPRSSARRCRASTPWA